MKTEKITIVFLILLLVSCKTFSQNDTLKNPIVERNISKIHKENYFPLPIGYVNDYEQVFTIEQIEKLENLITDFEKLTTNEIAIVTISQIEPYENFKDFTTDLSNNWGVGKFEKDNGLVIVFSKTMKNLRISTGIIQKKY